MKKVLLGIMAICLVLATDVVRSQNKHLKSHQAAASFQPGFTDAASFGFSPGETGVKNVKALQSALDKEGTVVISKPGTYKVSGTAFIGSNTSLIFGNGVVIQKSAENGSFCHVFLNKGALTRTYNHNITITGLNLDANGVDKAMDEIYGLRGHVSFFYVRDLKIERFRATGFDKAQFCLHICTFEDLLIDDAILKGKKDGIHLGKGKRFRISNVVFETGDDAIALVPGDWVSANPEFGILEDGLIENCTDIPHEYLQGAFAKIVPSAWLDWNPGILVRHGDAVVSNGRIYRVLAKLDDKQYKSITRPNFENGKMMLDSINWLMFQKDTSHTAYVRNVTFRNINLHTNRIPFQLTSYSGASAHSYYPGAAIPNQGEITLDNIRVLNDHKRFLVWIGTPCDILHITNTTLKNNSIRFRHAKDYAKYPATHISLTNCIFTNTGSLPLVTNESPGKEIFLKTSGSMQVAKDFSAEVDQGPGKIYVESDLTGLKN